MARLIAGFGANLPVALGCVVRRIDHPVARCRIETATGSILAEQVIVTLPTNVLAEGKLDFTPPCPAKLEAAAALPLGLADKLFMSLDEAEEFSPDSRAFAHTDRIGTASYNLRPLGRPQIEAYFGGSLAADLERGGEDAFFRFAVEELVGIFGSAFAARLRPLRATDWGRDPFALGSYSYARPGKAERRASLAEPVDERLFFAGEACSAHDFSTAHGAFASGRDAAERIIAIRGKSAG